MGFGLSLVVQALWKRLLSLTLAAGLLVGGPSGCVTAKAMEHVFGTPSSGAGDVALKVGLATAVFPLTLSLDATILVLGVWIYGLASQGEASLAIEANNVQ